MEGRVDSFGPLSNLQSGQGHEVLKTRQAVSPVSASCINLVSFVFLKPPVKMQEGFDVARLWIGSRTSLKHSSSTAALIAFKDLIANVCRSKCSRNHVATNGCGRNNIVSRYPIGKEEK